MGQREQYYITDSHEAIIEKELFDKVQDEMKKRTRLVLDEDGSQASSGNRFSSKYLLGNLLVCGYCGKGYRRRTERGKVLWRCSERMEKGKKECSESPTINDKWIRNILAKEVCDGIYNENIVRDRILEIEAYNDYIVLLNIDEIRTQIDLSI